ncbi:MAG: response regulator [Elusimicrobiales bacterium]|nr:response regulator [Elusimicrobiales bacterium]
MKTKRILIVDDDPNVGLLVSAILKQQGFKVVPLYNGDEVLDFLKKEIPDLILLDLKMPGIDGFALCKKIRETQKTKNIPIIILSGVSKVETKINTIELGADDFITKPFDVGELRARINRILMRKKTDISLNPLTQLPGSPTIQDETLTRTKNSEDFGFAYIDVDNFKAYNDVYGYAKGDDIIRAIANILNDKIRQFPQAKSFIGHIGGDDFVFISDEEHIDSISKDIVAEFDSKIKDFYKPEHLKTGHITIPDRKGTIRNFPIMTLTIAIIVPKNIKHYAKLVEKAAELKGYAKKLSGRKGSIYFRDRRD